MLLDTSMHEMDGDESQGYLFDQLSLHLRTMMLAECISFDAARNCVTVQPLLQTNIDGQISNIPPIKDIPVGFYQAGGFAVTHKPSAGDVCMLLISDRNISQWKLTGGIIDPKSPQHHNMNDAVAYFGLSAFPDAIGGIKGGIDIRSKDGGNSLNVASGTATLTLGGTEIFTATASGITFGVHVDMPQGATINGREFINHTHDGVESGGDNSGGVV